MTSHPIIMQAESVRAILDGRKTMTRRIVQSRHTAYIQDRDEDGWYFEDEHGHFYKTVEVCPYGKSGDLLWVREAFQYVDTYPEPDVFGPYLYKANGDRGKFRSPIHMPKSASRLTLEITDIRVERLQDITDEDAVAEGVEMLSREGQPNYAWRDYFPRQITMNLAEIGVKIRTFENTYGCYGPKQSYRSMWDSINFKRAPWESNPWVWKIQFTRKDAQ